MNSKERGILIGLAIVLAGAMAFFVWKAKEQDAGEGAAASRPPEEWDTGRLPDLGKPLREETTPGGVRVLIYSEGHGDPVKPGQAMDVAYTGYSAVSGAIFDRGVMRGLVLERGGVIPGWIEGLQGVRPREKRRLLIPAAMAYGNQRKRNIAPNSDLVFDVEWVRLEATDVREGSGKQAGRGSRVLVHYKGTLENGFVFDSSYTRGEPIWLTLKRGPGGVIDGWVEGIQGMKVGGVRKLWIPWHMAYGERAQQKIPGYSNLEFVVELLDVE